MINELERTRAKVLGVLVKDARVAAGRSLEDCANLLGISSEEFNQIERGERELSMPDLEVLSMYLNVPMSHFWGTQAINNPWQSDYEELLELRRQIIGGQVRRARIESGYSVEQLAEMAQLSASDLEAYETGEKPVPLLSLDRLAKVLGVSLDYFVDRQHGPLAEHEKQQKMLQRYQAMPEELRAFVLEPINRSYIETAKHLSELDVNRLRQIAESILDITF